MKFSDNMIGKRVRDNNNPDDTGTILRKVESLIYAGGDGVMVRWMTGEFSGEELSIGLADVTFIDSATQPQEITIDGKRYKLTLIKD